MKRDLDLFISDIAESAELISNSVRNVSKESFEKNLDLRDATIRRLEVIGEAVKNIPASVRDKYPDIPWKDIAGFRDVVLHSYFRIDLDILWKVVKDELPPLKAKILKVGGDLKKEKQGKQR